MEGKSNESVAGSSSSSSRNHQFQSLLKSLPSDHRGNIQLDRLTEEQKKSLCEELSDEDQDVSVDSDDDVDWQPPRTDESDVEDLVAIGEMENAVEINSDYEDDVSASEDKENGGQNFAAQEYVARDGTVWRTIPLPTSQTPCYNILRESGGPLSSSKLLTPLQVFNLILTDEMKLLIVRETNRKARNVFFEHNQKYPEKKRSWRDLTLEEFNAFIGILITSGVHHSNTEHVTELWKSDALPLYKASLSRQRFHDILRFIRFDNCHTRIERQASDKAAPIKDLWQMLNYNLRRHFKPYENMTIDEKLFPYRGRTKFTQYIPSKPAKYGIKVFWLADSKTGYPLQGIIYTGKEEGADRQVNIGEKVVTNLCNHYQGSGRNITTDNFFTSLSLAKDLRSKRLTMRKNKAFIPSEMQASKSREVHSTVFGFSEHGTMCSYVPKKNKAVILLSTMHTTSSIDRTTEAKKPEIILHYNSTKLGVDQMDQMVTQFSTKRKTNRWPLAFFYNILDVSALAAYIIFTQHNPNVPTKTDRRRIFLKNLGRELCLPSVVSRSQKPLTTRFHFVRIAMESVLGTKLVPAPNLVATPTQERDQTGRLKFTGYCQICKNERRRKTRKKCSKCDDPVCDQHTNPAPTICNNCE